MNMSEELTSGDIVLIEYTGERDEEPPVIIGEVNENDDGLLNISQIDTLTGKPLPSGLVVDENWEVTKIGVEYNTDSKLVTKESGEKVDATEYLWIDIDDLM